MSEDVELLRRQLDRERAARKEAERLLTDKSEKLYVLNQRLQHLNDSLERIVLERTKEMRRAEKRWRFALTGSGDGVWEFSTQDGAVFFSSGFKQMLGLQEHEVLDTLKAWREKAHPDDLPKIMEIFRSYRDEEIVTHRIEYRVKHKDGSYRWMLDRGMVLEMDQAGTVQRLIGTHTDIHYLKTIELELARSNDQMKTLIANMHTAILLEDPQRRVLLTNGSFCRMLNIPATPDELIGSDRSAALEYTASQFKAPQAFAKRMAELLKRKELVVGERLYTADGRVLERSFIPIMHNGDHIGQLWKYVDVTTQVKIEETLRRQEEKYRNIIANMNLGLVELDLDDRIRYVNQSFCEMSGYPAKELIGSAASEVLMSGDPMNKKQEQNGLSKQGPADAYELKVRDRDGRERWWLLSGALLHNDQGRLQGSIRIHLDITERKHLEDDLRLAKSEAEQGAKAKERFLAHMSHEIRTPMNAIMGLGRELARSTLDGLQRQHVEALNTATDNLLVIINDILDNSKIDAGKLDLEHVGFNMENTIRDVERVLAHRAGEKGLVFSAAVDPSVSPVLIGDPNRIKQVLFNIVGNAVKFTQVGSVSIHVRAELPNDDGQVLTIDVKDTGPGMSEEFKRRLFNPYSQERNTSGGTGLGMSITKQLLEFMHGSIAIESQLGTGTTVSIQIPFPIGDEHDLPALPLAAADTRALNGLRILLVEDNDMNRMVADLILQRQGIQVTEAHDGQQALDRLQDQQFDMVLMDVHMPVMDGLEASRAIREDLKLKLPIIALTANALKGELEKCQEAGMDAMLTKPFLEADLLTLLLRFAPSGPGNARVQLVDLSKIREISLGDEAFVERMVGLFREQAPSTVVEMREALSKSDPQRVGYLAHRLKSSIDAMGIRTLHAVIRELETVGRSGNDEEKLSPLLDQLEQRLAAALQELE